MRVRIGLALAVVASSIAVFLPATAASGAPGQPTVTVLSNRLAAPFNLQTSKAGLLVADGGPGFIGVVRKSGSIKKLVANAPGTSGVAVGQWGKKSLLAYTTTEGGEAGITASTLEITGPNGYHVSADTLKYETTHNPDGNITYGIVHPTACQSANWPTKDNGPINYKGGIDSHSYSVAALHDGSFVVADAGANNLLHITPTGKITTIAVLPRQPLLFTKAVAKGLGLPSCFVGATYYFESVPTDVEVDAAGRLWATTLPGGPEDPSLGARGSLYYVNPATGSVRRLATGFSGATNVAIGSHGKAFVAEFFAGRISKYQHGKVSTYVELPGVVAVENLGSGKLLAATLGSDGSDGQPPAPGTVVRIAPR